MEGGGGAAAYEPAASTEAAAAGTRTFNVQAVRQYCDDYSESMKGQTGRDLLFDFKDMHKNLPHFGSVSNADGSFLGISDASELELGRGIAALVQGTLLEAHLEGTAHEAKLSVLTEGEKFEALMEHFDQERNAIRVWLRDRFDKEEKKKEAQTGRGGSQSIVFTSQPLPEVPSDGKDHEPSVRLLQYKVLGAIRALPDTPAKNITSIRKALNKSTKLSTKAMTMHETLRLSYHSDEIERMSEYEMLDAFFDEVSGRSEPGSDAGSTV